MKEIRVFQDVDFKLVGARDMDPREVLPGAPVATTDRDSEADPSISDIARVSDEAATVVYIEGWASMFLNPDGSRLEDRDGESVSISLLDIDNYKKNPVLVYNHDWGDVLGKITHIEKTGEGLYVKAEVHKLTGRESVFESVQKGLVVTFSIGFVPKTFTYIEEDDVLEISSAELVEISLAPVPANQDALFVATSQKSLTLATSIVKDQNDMTCDELTGICTMSKQIKGKEMENVMNKEAETVEPKKEEVVTPQKVEVEMDMEKLADTIAAANEANEVRKAEKEATEAAEKQAQADAEEEATKKRVEDALAYIKEQKDVIESTAAEDIDTDQLESFYELLSDTVELIDSKIVEAVSAA